MEKEGGQVCVRVYMHLDVRLCSYASNGDGERERDREGNDKRYYTTITFALGPRVALRAWAIREQAGRQASKQPNERASERAGSVRTTTEYIDFDFRRRAHLVLSGSAHSYRFRLPSYRGHWSCPCAKEGPRRVRRHGAGVALGF